MQGIKGNEYTVANGVAFIDVSTPKIPDAWAIVDEADLLGILSGQGRWAAVRGVSALYAVRRGRLMHRQLLGLKEALRLADMEMPHNLPKPKKRKAK